MDLWDIGKIEELRRRGRSKILVFVFTMRNNMSKIVFVFTEETHEFTMRNNNLQLLQGNKLHRVEEVVLPPLGRNGSEVLFIKYRQYREQNYLI